MLRRGVAVGHLACYLRAPQCHFPAELLRVVVCLTDALAAERVCRDEVGPGFQVFPVDIRHDVGPRDVQQVVVTTQLTLHSGQPRVAEVGLRQSVFLNHGTHGTIEYHDSLLNNLF